MYVSLGMGKYERAEDIIGIFDLDITSQSRITMNYLNTREKAGKIRNAAEDIPKTFVVTGSGDVYLSGPAATTLIKRIEEQV